MMSTITCREIGWTAKGIELGLSKQKTVQSIDDKCCYLPVLNTSTYLIASKRVALQDLSDLPC
jgi:hypothetical protein